MDKKAFVLQAEFCKAMSHPVRLEIIDLLKEGELSVGDMAAKIGITQANLSQHLAVLRERKVVAARKDGMNTYYSLSSAKIVQACTLVRSILEEQSAREMEALASLRR